MAAARQGRTEEESRTRRGTLVSHGRLLLFTPEWTPLVELPSQTRFVGSRRLEPNRRRLIVDKCRDSVTT